MIKLRKYLVGYQATGGRASLRIHTPGKFESLRQARQWLKEQYIEAYKRGHTHFSWTLARIIDEGTKEIT